MILVTTVPWAYSRFASPRTASGEKKVHRPFSLRHNIRMTSASRFSHRPRPGRRSIFALFLGLAITAGGASLPGHGVVAAQGQNPCGLLTSDEVQALVPQEHVDEGVATAFPDINMFSCRYTWGTGTKRSTLAVFVSSAARRFAGMNPESIKQVLVSSIAPDTVDAAIPEVGEAAVFKAQSPVYVSASAYLKDRILQINLDGIDADLKKDQLISLLKSAASRM